MTTALSTRVEELTTTGVPFVQATVVRAQEPTSARPGDRAIILADGSIEGFVGGVCAETSVRAAALDALRDGNTLLLRVLPSESEQFPSVPGAQVVVNPCLSGGAIEIFLRPVLPRPLIGVAGECEQVLALVGIQPERIGDCRQHTGRGPGLAALLQPRVPGQTDVGELGDLFPAQARDPPHPPIGQPHLGRAQPGAAGAEEGAQLAAAVPHRTAGRAGLLIIGHSTHDRPRIPRPLASCQVVALPGAASAGWRAPERPH